MNNIKEIWKNICGYIGLYMVSNYGRIKSLEKLVNNRYGKILRKEQNIKIQKLKKSDHRYVFLSKNNISKFRYIHRLVLETFIGPCPEGMECRHLDGNPANNRLNNLKWGTYKENQLDRFTHKTSNLGSRNGISKLKEKDIPIIRDLIKKGFSDIQIGKIFNINRQTIRDIRLNKTWKHIK